MTQRSAVVLKDVLGYSLEEISGTIYATLPAVKAALHRGRARLRELAREPDDLSPPALPDDERARAHHAHDLGRRANRRIDVLGRNRRAPALGKGILPARCRRGEGDRRQKKCSG